MTYEQLPAPPVAYSWEPFPEIDGAWLLCGGRRVAAISNITQSKPWVCSTTVMFVRDHLETGKLADISCETAEQAVRAAFAAFGY